MKNAGKAFCDLPRMRDCFYRKRVNGSRKGMVKKKRAVSIAYLAALLCSHCVDTFTLFCVCTAIQQDLPQYYQEEQHGNWTISAPIVLLKIIVTMVLGPSTTRRCYIVPSSQSVICSTSGNAFLNLLDQLVVLLTTHTPV